jgi:hypothetical protein
MKYSAEHQRFANLVDRVLSVSHEELKRREAEYKRQSDANPRKRGPKRKVRPPSASPGPAATPPS